MTIEIPLFLNSIDGVKPISKPHDFVTDFEVEMDLDSTEKHIAMDRINMSYSWYNVRDSYGNKKMKYSHDKDVTWTEIELDDGNYKYRDIQEAIRSKIKANGHSKSDTDVSISFVSTSIKCLIRLDGNFRLDLTVSKFAKLIGFEKIIVNTTSLLGTLTPDITWSVDIILVRCDLLSDSNYSGKNSDILYAFPMIDKSLSYPFEIRPRRLLYSLIRTNHIKRVRIRITDGLDRPLDLNDVEISLTLLLKSEFANI